MAQQHGLGRGLASLIPPKKNAPVAPIAKQAVSAGSVVSFEAPMEVKDETGKVLEIAVEEIVPNPHQPRIYFSEEKLAELSESIKEHGILQPLIVTKNGEKQYELIAGERRFQAAKLAGIKSVPVIVREAKDQQKFELAIIENVQRHDLNPIEEAKAYRKLMDEFGLSQEAVAKKMGKSRSAVANISRLLQLPVEIQRALTEGRISEGHAKALLALDNPEKQRALFEMIIANGLTVREAEAKAREVSTHTPKRTLAADPVLREKEEHLAEIFGTKVRINKAGKGGKIVIEYYGEEDLTHLMDRLTREAVQ
ncbi:MAG: ParB/RepB/Spo0J family partition protein [Candidatus Moranbacteria bacterium]|nr:ParB/RepB/Spo0J family partition protein [Candidatus Moranbacteria bacterium]